MFVGNEVSINTGWINPDQRIGSRPSDRKRAGRADVWSETVSGFEPRIIGFLVTEVRIERCRFLEALIIGGDGAEVTDVRCDNPRPFREVEAL